MVVQIADIGGIAISSEGTAYLSGAHNIILDLVGFVLFFRFLCRLL